MNLPEMGRGNVLDRSGSGQGKVANFYKCCNEHPDSIICAEFLD